MAEEIKKAEELEKVEETKAQDAQKLDDEALDDVSGGLGRSLPVKDPYATGIPRM